MFKDTDSKTNHSFINSFAWKEIELQGRNAKLVRLFSILEPYRFKFGNPTIVGLLTLPLYVSFISVENHGGVLDHTLSHTAYIHRSGSRREETLRNHGLRVYILPFVAIVRNSRLSVCQRLYLCVCDLIS